MNTQTKKKVWIGWARFCKGKRIRLKHNGFNYHFKIQEISKKKSDLFMEYSCCVTKKVRITVEEL